MKTNEDVRNALLEMYDEDMANNVVLFESPDYADAVIGTSEENDVVRLIYSCQLPTTQAKWACNCPSVLTTRRKDMSPVFYHQHRCWRGVT